MKMRVQESRLIFHFYTGRMDIDISLVEDSRRLAKQCKMADLMEALENKCKQVYEYGKTALLVLIYASHTCYVIDTTC